MAQDKFMFFPNFKAMADKLDSESRLAFYDALTDYVFFDKEPSDPIISALIEAIKPSLNKIDGRRNNGGNHNPNGVNQHSKSGQSGQTRSKLVNSGQFLSETETETEIKEKGISDDIPKKKITDETKFQAGFQFWKFPIEILSLAKKHWTAETIRKIEQDFSCREYPTDISVQELLETYPSDITKRFVKPTLDEVRVYCRERNNTVDPERFMDFYDSNGWKVGKNPMKDWRSAVRNWERSGYNTTTKPKKVNPMLDPCEDNFLRENPAWWLDDNKKDEK